jgi:hypothetical protein
MGLNAISEFGQRDVGVTRITRNAAWRLRQTLMRVLTRAKNREKFARGLFVPQSDHRIKWQTWQTFAIPKSRLSCLESGGREGIRTPGLLVANEALSQLSYSPTSSNQ